MIKIYAKIYNEDCLKEIRCYDDKTNQLIHIKSKCGQLEGMIR